jgi:hypothetical protein
MEELDERASTPASIARSTRKERDTQAIFSLQVFVPILSFSIEVSSCKREETESALFWTSDNKPLLKGLREESKDTI